MRLASCILHISVCTFYPASSIPQPVILDYITYLHYYCCAPTYAVLLGPHIIVRVNHSRNHIKVACTSNTLTHPPLIWEKEISTNSNRTGRGRGNTSPNCYRNKGAREQTTRDRTRTHVREHRRTNRINRNHSTPAYGALSTPDSAHRSSYYSDRCIVPLPPPSPPLMLSIPITVLAQLQSTVHKLPMTTPFASISPPFPFTLPSYTYPHSLL